MEAPAARCSGPPAVVVLVAALIQLAIAPGCASTSISAAEVRAPVLWGPVPCIGCGPQPVLAPSSPSPPLRVTMGNGRIGVALIWIFPVPVMVGAGELRSLDMSLDRLFAWQPCASDVRLTDLRARAWFAVVPIFYYQYEVALSATARVLDVEGGSCPGP